MPYLKHNQSPEIFEQLAIEYAVGALQGRTRKRFEVLMETHFYLRSLVDDYENIFAHLVELLPVEKPSKKVWNKIDKHINLSQQRHAEEKPKLRGLLCKALDITKMIQRKTLGKRHSRILS